MFGNKTFSLISINDYRCWKCVTAREIAPIEKVYFWCSDQCANSEKSHRRCL